MKFIDFYYSYLTAIGIEGMENVEYMDIYTPTCGTKKIKYHHIYQVDKAGPNS
jgi:hypothetical protein